MTRIFLLICLSIFFGCSPEGAESKPDTNTSTKNSAASGIETTLVSIESGPQKGEMVGAFHVEKCAGNEADGVSNGQKLCYRCKLGNRPVVAVFARTADDSLANLVAQLDSFVAENEAAQAASFVNLLGDDAESLRVKANWIVEKSGAEHVAIVVPEEHENGPKSFKLNPEADVTVLAYNHGTVVTNIALTPGKLDSEVIQEIKTTVSGMVN